MRHRAGWIIFSAVLLCGLPLGAQENSCTHRSIAVNVIEANGRKVGGLNRSSFQASYRRSAVKIVSATWDEQPRRVFILVDESGSMSERSIRDLEFNAATEITAEMPAKTQIGIGFFARQLEPSVNLTLDREALSRELENFRTRSRTPVKGAPTTALWDSMIQSLSWFGPAQVGDVLYVISDGGENASKAQWNELERAFLTSGVRLFVVLVRWRSQPTPEAAQPPYLLAGAKETGGYSLYDFVSDLDTGSHAIVNKGGHHTWLAEGLGLQVRLMAGFYRLEIELPEAVDKPREWRLELATSPKREYPMVIYPHKLAACSSGASSALNSK